MPDARVSGPIPGKNANRVGEELTPKRKRLDWLDPVAVGVPVPERERLARRRVGNAEHGLELPRAAKENGEVDAGVPVRELLKSCANTRVTATESFGSGVDSSGRLKVIESRAVVRSSVTCSEFCQLKPPIRMGVSKLSAVTRLLPVWAIVSRPPPGTTWTTLGSRVLELVLLVKLRPGDR